MFRSFQLRLNPNKAQRAALEHVLADSCETYNAALQERRDAWKLQRKSISYFDQCAELTELRKDPQFATIALDIQREPLRRVDRSFKAFFRRCKAGEKAGFPRFRSRHRYDSFAFGLPRIRNTHIRIPNLGDFRFKASQEISGVAKSAIVKRLGKKWVIRLVCDIGPAPAKAPISAPVGIDLGLIDFITLSDGSVVPAPRFVRKHAQAIARKNQNLARKKRGSKNRLRAKEELRRVHQHVADARKNFCHHVSKQLVTRYDAIFFEALNIKSMAQGHFAKSILDAAWAQLIWQISYKAESAGRYAVAVDPRGTTLRCSRCGERVPKALVERQHDCPKCGLSLGRDHNAALNVLRLGRSRVDVLAEGLH